VSKSWAQVLDPAASSPNRQSCARRGRRRLPGPRAGGARTRRAATVQRRGLAAGRGKAQADSVAGTAAIGGGGGVAGEDGGEGELRRITFLLSEIFSFV
jgi:hypothetical protein